MNNAGGFITLHRQITKWEWYKDSSTKDLFLHLLLTANFVDTRFLGKLIKRGQVVTSLPSLASETGLSIQNVRTALKHLISTGEVTDKANRQYRIITVVKYDEYQSLTDDITVSQQTANRQLTDSQQYHNNNNKNNKVTRKQYRESAKRFTPPTKEEIFDFCLDERIGIDVDRFFDYYTSNGWKVGRNSMKDWRAAVRSWAKRDAERPVVSGYIQTKPATKTVAAQNYTQRDYSNEQEEATRRMVEELGKGIV